MGSLADFWSPVYPCLNFHRSEVERPEWAGPLGPRQCFTFPRSRCLYNIGNAEGGLVSGEVSQLGREERKEGVHMAENMLGWTENSQEAVRLSWRGAPAVGTAFRKCSRCHTRIGGQEQEDAR